MKKKDQNVVTRAFHRKHISFKALLHYALFHLRFALYLFPRVRLALGENASKSQCNIANASLLPFNSHVLECLRLAFGSLSIAFSVPVTKTQIQRIV